MLTEITVSAGDVVLALTVFRSLERDKHTLASWEATQRVIAALGEADRIVIEAGEPC